MNNDDTRRAAPAPKAQAAERLQDTASGGFPHLFESGLQLQLWLAVLLLGLPEETLAALGLNKAAFEREMEPYRAEIDCYAKLRATSQLISRNETAELLRCRVNTMALAARTPAELAAVARAVKTLPDWVWEDALVHADSAGPGAGVRQALSHSARPAPPAAGDGPGSEEFFIPDAALLTGLNRQQRRAIESRLRKSRG